MPGHFFFGLGGVLGDGFRGLFGLGLFGLGLVGLGLFGQGLFRLGLFGLGLFGLGLSTTSTEGRCRGLHRSSYCSAFGHNDLYMMFYR
jgi:hypothetical protein